MSYVYWNTKIFSQLPDIYINYVIIVSLNDAVWKKGSQSGSIRMDK